MIFGWCMSGDHKDCRREIERYYWEKGKMVKTGEVYVCQCPKRGCKCYVKKADRAKTRKRK